MAGFGRSTFGLGPFGKSDVGGDLVVDIFPDELMDDSLILQPGETLKNNSQDPLLKLLKMYAHSVSLRRDDIDNLTNILDPETSRLDLVRLFGQTLGVDVDKNDPDFLQRSFLKNASQWLQIKASTRGYEVRGLASGFNVSVTNYWRIDPAYEPLIPPFFLFFLRPVSADPTAPFLLHTSQPPGTFVGTPTVEDETYAKSAYLKTVFSVSIYQPNVNYNKLLDLVILKIRDVVGIHHELTAPQFLVLIPVTVTPIASIDRIDEVTDLNFAESQYYDLIPADVEPTDFGPITVEITTGSENDNILITASIDISVVIQDNNFVPINIVAIPTLSMEIDEFANHGIVSEGQYFDIVCADVEPTDEPISIFMSTGQQINASTSVSGMFAFLPASETTLMMIPENVSVVLDTPTTPTVIPVNAIPSAALFSQEFWSLLIDNTVDPPMICEEHCTNVGGEGLIAFVSPVVQITQEADSLIVPVNAVPAFSLQSQEKSFVSTTEVESASMEIHSVTKLAAPEGEIVSIDFLSESQIIISIEVPVFAEIATEYVAVDIAVPLAISLKPQELANFSLTEVESVSFTPISEALFPSIVQTIGISTQIAESQVSGMGLSDVPTITLLIKPEADVFVTIPVNTSVSAGSIYETLSKAISGTPFLALSAQEFLILPPMTDSVSASMIVRETTKPSIVEVESLTEIIAESETNFSTLATIQAILVADSVALNVPVSVSGGILAAELVKTSVSGLLIVSSFVKAQEQTGLSISESVSASMGRIAEQLSSSVSGSISASMSLTDQEKMQISLSISGSFKEADERTSLSVSGNILAFFTKEQESLKISVSGVPGIAPKIAETVTSVSGTGLVVFVSQYYDAVPADVVPCDQTILVKDTILAA